MRSLFISLIAASCALVIPVFASAQNTQLSQNVYLMSNLLNFTRGQAVSIDFCNIARVARDAKIYLVDANGNTLKAETVRAAPGQSAGISFSFSEISRTSQARVGVRGVVILADPPGETDPPEPDLSLASMEVYDVSTGKTTFGLLLPAVRNPKVLLPTDQ